LAFQAVTGDGHIGLARYYNLQFAAGGSVHWGARCGTPRSLNELIHCTGPPPEAGQANPSDPARTPQIPQ